MIPLITIKEFRDGEGWRKLLGEAFEHNQSVIKVALQALKAQAMVTGDPPQKQGVHPDACAMQEYHRLKGWNQAILALENMRFPAPEKSELEKATQRPPFEDYVGDESVFMQNAPPKPETYFSPKA